MTYNSFKELAHWLNLSKDTYQLFTELFEETIKQNQHTNTTRILSEDDFFIKNILDSLLITKVYPQLLSENLRLADVGCGGGFPCLPLALINDKLSICAIDSNNKKTTAVNQLAEKLGLRNLTALHIRAREAGRKEDKFDFVTARAVAPANCLIKECRQLLTRQGKIILYKTPQQFNDEEMLIEREVKNYKLSYSVSQLLELPNNQGERIFITVQR